MRGYREETKQPIVRTYDDKGIKGLTKIKNGILCTTCEVTQCWTFKEDEDLKWLGCFG